MRLRWHHEGLEATVRARCAPVRTLTADYRDLLAQIRDSYPVARISVILAPFLYLSRS
jgi:hypothetical protein